MHEDPGRQVRRPNRVAIAALGAVMGAIVGAGFAIGALVSDPVAAPVGAAPADADWRAASAVGFLELGSAQLAYVAALDGAWVASVAASLTAGTSADTQARAAALLGAVAARKDVPTATREAAADALLAHLDARRPAGSRGAVGSAVIAAAALARAQDLPDRAQARRLASLAVGGAPHPDLPVRVECAAAALERTVEPELQRDMTAFLLAVLRAETPDQDRSPRSWDRMTTLAWVKTRAAQALSRAAGTELRFRPDGSWAHQTAEADRLERALASGASPR